MGDNHDSLNRCSEVSEHSHPGIGCILFTGSLGENKEKSLKKRKTSVAVISNCW